MWRLEPEGEAEKPEVTVLWNEGGLLRQSCCPSLEGGKETSKLFLVRAFPLLVSRSSAGNVCMFHPEPRAPDSKPMKININGARCCGRDSLFSGLFWTKQRHYRCSNIVRRMDPSTRSSRGYFRIGRSGLPSVLHSVQKQQDSQPVSATVRGLYIDVASTTHSP